MTRHNKINQVAILGFIGNSLLFIAKISIGIITRSQTMLADGFNSAGDVFSSIMTYIGNRIAAQPGDKDHPYGHGKAEYIFSMIISFSLLLVAFSIFRSSLNALFSRQTFIFSPWLIIISLATLVTKLLLYRFANKVSKEHNSLLAAANAEDHRNDLFITTLTLFSVIGGYFGIYFIDGVGGILISFWITFTGFKIFTSAYQVLMDTNVDPALMKKISYMIRTVHGVDHIDAIHAKPVGHNFLLIVKVSIDAYITVYDGHRIAHKICRLLEQHLENIDEVIVHVNPAQYHPESMDETDSN